MHLAKSCAVGVLLISVKLAIADSYANNQNPTVVDAPQVAAKFPAVERIELLSPAFVNPEGVPESFANGTSGPTPQYTLGMYIISRGDVRLTRGRKLYQKSLESHRMDYVS
jgi:hypothetical protein